MKHLQILLCVMTILCIGCQHSQTSTLELQGNSEPIDASSNNEVILDSSSKEIGPEGGELNVSHSGSPIQGVALLVPENAFSEMTVVSITPVLDLPKKQDCVVSNGILISMNPAVKIDPSSRIMLSIPFNIESTNDLTVRLVYPYDLTSHEWAQDPIAPLPSPRPGYFYTMLNTINPDIAYFPVVCDYSHLVQ